MKLMLFKTVSSRFHFTMKLAHLPFRSLSHSNMTSVSARKPPTCTRCRNHGIYGVQLKGHRNSCKYKLCNCKNCRLILERRLVHDVIKPSRPQKGQRRKSGRKEHPSRRLEMADNKGATRETAIGTSSRKSLPPSFSHGNDKPRVQPTFTNTRTFNRGEVLNMRDGSINLARTQFSSNYPSLSNPPHPYGYLHCYPRLRNFSPLAAPNITIGPTSVPRMLALPPPDQSNMFLNFSGAHREVTTQGFALRPSQTSSSIQQQMDRY